MTHLLPGKPSVSLDPDVPSALHHSMVYLRLTGHVVSFALNNVYIVYIVYMVMLYKQFGI